MFDLFKEALNKLNADWKLLFGKARLNSDIRLTRTERRKIERKRNKQNGN